MGRSPERPAWLQPAPPQPADVRGTDEYNQGLSENTAPIGESLYFGAKVLQAASDRRPGRIRTNLTSAAERTQPARGVQV
jgi:hypothetical protein